ncbi:hypothetical protein BDN72DRAFT_836910 [Pluteus cervinus]|uniref:Uncharacterized protein n=1 Tax=Pluteus cervinus TaxID=181527 RepID=A0ACD3B1T0_9AGAR|nr:hypothetical protein BDN72DRAFT_836910 [Pluteus cervinus]
MNLNNCPSDIILTISSYLDNSTNLQLRLLSRSLHDSVTPTALRHAYLAFNKLKIQESENLIQTCRSRLPNLSRYVQHLTTDVQGWYIARHVPEESLPDLWEILSSFTSLKSLTMSWKFGIEVDPETEVRIRDMQVGIASALMKATGGRLETLIIHPPSGELLIPKPLLDVRGLVEFEVVYERDAWFCNRTKPTDGEPEHSCKCRLGALTTALESILPSNPGLETLTLVCGCNGTGYPIQHVFLPQMTNLHSISMRGLNPTSISTLVPPGALRNIRHVDFQSDHWAFNLDPLWKSMKAAGTTLESLSTAQVSLDLVEFIASFSGLNKLKLFNIQSGELSSSEKITSTFWDIALPRHAPTLEMLSISWMIDVDHIPGWAFNRIAWTPILSKMVMLKSLHIHPDPSTMPSYSTHTDSVPMVASSYQAILDAVQVLPSLESLEIYWSTRSFGPARKSVWIKASRKVLGEAAKRLWCAGETLRPMELCLFNEKYFASVVEQEEGGEVFWTYRPSKASTYHLGRCVNLRGFLLSNIDYYRS